jgi:urate oxidase
VSGIILANNQYGKAESRVVRIYRDAPRHEIHDVNVTTCLRGDFSAAYLEGDQSAVLPADSQKQTAYTLCEGEGPGFHRGPRAGAGSALPPRRRTGSRTAHRDRGMRLERAVVDGAEHDYTWMRKGQEVRTAAITVEGDQDGWSAVSRIW